MKEWDVEINTQIDNITKPRGYEIWYYDNPSDLINKISKYTKYLNNEDIVVLSLHWGSKSIIKVAWESDISNYKLDLAKELIEVGVKIIHGTSTHHIEMSKANNDDNYVITYGIGDDYAIDEYYRNDLGMIVYVDINNKGKINDVYIQPTYIHDTVVYPI